MRVGWRHVFDNDANLMKLHAREAFEAGSSPMLIRLFDVNETEERINPIFGEVVRAPVFVDLEMTAFWGPIAKAEKPGEKPQLDVSGNLKVILLTEHCQEKFHRSPTIRDHVVLNGREYTTVSVGEGKTQDQILFTYELEVSPYGR